MKHDMPNVSNDGIQAFNLLDQPVWVFDRETLRFLFVNTAGQGWLGYDEDELAGMTIVDLRPKQDQFTIRKAATDATDLRTDAGTWRIVTKNGDIREAAFSWRRLRFCDRDAVLATIKDVTRLEATRREKEAVVRENAILREPYGIAIEQFRILFEAAPGSMLVLRPGSYEILAASDAYIRTAMTRREDLLGKTLLEAFPDHPDEPAANGVHRLRASLRRVEALLTPDAMGVLRHPIRRPDGSFEERYWIILNVPVQGPTGELAYLIHRIEDVTGLIRNDDSGAAGDPEAGRSSPELQVYYEDVYKALKQLQEEQARRSAAERLLNLGIWEHHLETGALNWSDPVFDLYGVPKDGPAPDFKGYVALVHPDDRDRIEKTFEEFIQTGETQLEFEHRILRPDGTVAHVRNVGQRLERAGREIIVGFLQDITGYVSRGWSPSLTDNLLQLAGEKARLGGWRVELDPEKVIWTTGTAAIHELPPDYAPSPDEAFSFYAPRHQARIVEVFTACIATGAEFEDICQLVTARGNHIWARLIGSAVRDEAGRIVAVQGAIQDITELHQSEQNAELAHQEKLGILESISDGFFVVDRDWAITYVNPKAAALMKRGQHSVLGGNLWAEFPGSFGSSFQVEYERALDTGSTVRFEAFSAPLATWFEVTAYPIADGLAVHLRDITEQHAKTQQLRLLESAISRLNDILLITEARPTDKPEGPKIVYVNDAFCRLTGYGREEVIGTTPRILQGPKTDGAELKRIRDALFHVRPVRCELLNYTKSGEELWLEIDIAPLIGADGRPTHFVAVERDVTTRKLLQEAQRVSEERFRLVSRATNEGIWDWDIRAGTLWWNESMQILAGHDPAKSEPSLEAWIDCLHPEDKERVLDNLDKVLKGEKATWTDEYRFRRGDGSDAVVIERGFVIRDKNGEALRMVGGMQDHTQQRALEDQLRESQKLEALGSLTGGIAHDFNNLLAIILGNAEMLAEKLQHDPRLLAMAEMALNAAERGAELTNRLLAFARRQPLNPRVLDPNQLVREMQELVRRTVTEDIEIKVLLEPDLWAIEVDQTQIEAALLNMAINARDAMPEGGTLTFETANCQLDGEHVALHGNVPPGEHVLIAVTDSGIGMDPQTASKVFEPFFTTKEVGKGSGLGLSMVLGFVQQSRGQIEILTKPGQGTTIRMFFPRCSGGTTQETAQRTDQIDVGGTEHVLVAEDDELVGELLSAQLRNLGYRVTVTRNGREALDTLEQLPDIDLLATDMVMPGGLNGRQVAEAGVRLRPNLKVLFVSGYAENAILHDGRLDPDVELLSKPYRLRELAIKVRNALDAS